MARRYLDSEAPAILVVGSLEALFAGDPDRREFSLDVLRRIPALSGSGSGTRNASSGR